VNLDHNISPPLNNRTNDAVNCLTHTISPDPNGGDQVTGNPAVISGQPFQFLAGDSNPIVSARGNNVVVSDSLVTVPVYDSSTLAPGSAQVNIIGFVQLFLNPDGNQAPGANGGVNTTVVNLVGCGTNASQTPILGNGASPVAVRLVTPSGS